MTAKSASGGEVGVGLAEKFEPGNLSDNRLKIAEIPRYLEDDDAIGRKTPGIGAQSHAAVIARQCVPQAAEFRTVSR
jgi:hypothetical protein